jgi:hypothetical protein
MKYEDLQPDVGLTCVLLFDALNNSANFFEQSGTPG